MKYRPKANGQKQARRLKAVVRNTRILNLKMKREQLIPTRVLKALSELHLPKNKKLYTKELNLLLSPRSEPPGGEAGGCATANGAAAGSFSTR